MKKLLSALVLVLMLSLCLASCGGKGPKYSEYLDDYVGFPYLTTDLSQYATLPESAYLSLSLSMDVTPEEVEEIILGLLDEHPIERTVTDRAVEDGDVIYLYYEGRVDGELFKGGSNMEDKEPHVLEIGSDSFIDGFEDALIGMIPADTLAADTYIDVTFPSDYRETSLAGKAAQFRVQIVSIIDGYDDRTELTVEFVTDVLGFETEESDVIAAFRAHILKVLRKDVADGYGELLCERLIELVLPSLTVTELPAAEVARQREIYLDEIEYYYDYYNYMYSIYYGTKCFESIGDCAAWYFGLDSSEGWSEALDDFAEDNVKRTMLLYVIAANEGITVTEKLFDETMDSLIAKYGATAEELIDFGGADLVYDTAIYSLVTDLLLSRATVDNGELPLDLN